MLCFYDCFADRARNGSLGVSWGSQQGWDYNNAWLVWAVDLPTLGDCISNMWVERLSDAHIVSIYDDPDYAMLDVGCTKARGGQAAAGAFIKVAVTKGLAYEFCLSTMLFVYATRSKTVCATFVLSYGSPRNRRHTHVSNSLNNARYLNEYH